MLWGDGRFLWRGLVQLDVAFDRRHDRVHKEGDGREDEPERQPAGLCDSLARPTAARSFFSERVDDARLPGIPKEREDEEPVDGVGGRRLILHRNPSDASDAMELRRY